MSLLPRLAATRLDLLRAEQRLHRLSRSTALLRRKREALVAELFHLARRAADARTAITRRTQEAYPALLHALAARGQSGLLALGLPSRDLAVKIRATQVWGVAVAEIEERPVLSRSLAARGTAPGPAGPAAIAAEEFEALADLLLDAAAREMLVQRLGQALAQTSRQVNSLERRLAPALRAQIARVHQGLEEREREEHARLSHRRGPQYEDLERWTTPGG